jgi:DNA-dependent protein kinase catalytic subunit
LQFIELPGQYSGLCKPQPELHVRVSSFDPKILVMGSLRRPKRLKIHGNDEKDYPYLVKGGEDLRLDQRVQQVRSRHQVFRARVCVDEPIWSRVR